MPASDVFEGMRAVAAGAPVPMAALLRGGGLSILYIGLACFLFARVHRSALRSGLIARYSAESVA
jgi:ABC-2 type transport system permease protein